MIKTTGNFLFKGKLHDGTEVEVHVCDLDYFMHSDDNAEIIYTTNESQSSCFKRDITFTDIEQ